MSSTPELLSKIWLLISLKFNQSSLQITFSLILKILSSSNSTSNLETKNQAKKSFGGKIGVLFLGNAAPGGNNVIDGLLKYQAQKKGTDLVGYLNGIDGIMDD